VDRVSRRRRPGTPIRRSPDETTILVICTGRGHHKRHRIDKLSVWAAEGAETVIEIESDTPQPVFEGGAPRLIARFVCNRCHRDVPLRMEKLTTLVSGLVDAGVSELDISSLQAATILK
jgi:hypothetical protein